MKRPICQEALKLIACVTMLIDHIGAVFFPQALWLRIIGRLAFPIYCFLMAEGIHYTRGPWRYCLRLGLGLLLSEPVFDLLFFGRLTWQHQSVMVTLLLACIMAACMKKLKAPTLRSLLLIPFSLLAELLGTDYGAVGVLTVGMFVLTRELPGRTFYQTAALTILNLLISGVSVSFGPVDIPVQLFAVAAMVPIALYSGKKILASPAVRWLFYLFYPGHLAILFLIRLLA